MVGQSLYTQRAHLLIYFHFYQNEPQQWWPTISYRQIYPEKMQNGLSTQHAVSTLLLWDLHFGCIFSAGHGYSLPHSLDFDHQFDNLASISESSLQFRNTVLNWKL